MLRVAKVTDNVYYTCIRRRYLSNSWWVSVWYKFDWIFVRFSLGCGGGGGGGGNDCSQCNDAFSDAPPTSQRPSQVNHPPLLQPLMGKHPNFKAPLQIKPSKNKNVRRGYKRYDVTYSTGDPYGMSTSPGYEYPCDPSYGNWPCQTPQAAPQQTSSADQVVGTLFLWKPNNLANDKPLPKKNPKAKPKN